MPFIRLLGRKLDPDEIFEPTKSFKKPGLHAKDDWQQLIDDTWGEGLPAEDKLALFEKAWTLLDEGYGGFVNRDVDMIALKDSFSTMINNGVSLGKFTAIMNHLSLAMQDAHTFITNIPVTWGTQAEPGIPLFVVNSATNNSRFGVVLTITEDEQILVLKVRSNHVLGLQPGDIILGYDNVLWKDLYPQLLEAMLPIQLNYVFGSTEKSLHDVFMRSAGLNWHLFDTLDVKKHETGEIVHLPTSPLTGQLGYIWGNEQLEIPGVPQPDFDGTDHITWGIIDGTTIGYIYAASWDWRDEYNISNDFKDAVINVQINNNTSGLIIDMRLNYGGSMTEANAGYSLLFNNTIHNIKFMSRNDPNDHFGMIEAASHPSYSFDIHGSTYYYYNKPIAVLTGPNAVSNGDWESVRLGWHPMARVFGKPTNGAFTISDYPDLENDDWFFYRATGSGYLLDEEKYMAHTSAPIDELVWFKPEDVAKGEDTVVKRAMAWIDSTTTEITDEPNTSDEYCLYQNYPNPFNPETTISYNIKAASLVVISIFDINGRLVETLVNRHQHSGKYSIKWHASIYSTGIYFIKIAAGDFQQTKKCLLLK